MTAGLFTVMFSIIAGVGLGNLEGVNLRSERNLFVLGAGLYNGEFNGPVNTPSQTFNDIVNSMCSTPAAVSLMTCLLLDLSIPAVPGERSEEGWQQQE